MGPNRRLPRTHYRTSASIEPDPATGRFDPHALLMLPAQSLDSIGQS